MPDKIPFDKCHIKSNHRTFRSLRSPHRLAFVLTHASAIGQKGYAFREDVFRPFGRRATRSLPAGDRRRNVEGGNAFDRLPSVDRRDGFMATGFPGRFEPSVASHLAGTGLLRT